MNFRLASTFNDSLLKLTCDEQKAVKTTVFDLQLNPANPGMSFHRLDTAKDKDFWSNLERINRAKHRFCCISRDALALKRCLRYGFR